MCLAAKVQEAVGAKPGCGAGIGFLRYDLNNSCNPSFNRSPATVLRPVARRRKTPLQSLQDNHWPDCAACRPFIPNRLLPANAKISLGPESGVGDCT
jgi:hypothetical protein